MVHTIDRQLEATATSNAEPSPPPPCHLPACPPARLPACLQALNSIAVFGGVSNHTQWALSEVLGDEEWTAGFLQQNQRLLERSYDALTGGGGCWVGGRSVGAAAEWVGVLALRRGALCDAWA